MGSHCLKKQERYIVTNRSGAVITMSSFIALAVIGFMSCFEKDRASFIMFMYVKSIHKIEVIVWWVQLSVVEKSDSEHKQTLEVDYNLSQMLNPNKRRFKPQASSKRRENFRLNPIRFRQALSVKDKAPFQQQDAVNQSSTVNWHPLYSIQDTPF
ncbi:hypothetical protein EDC96DRAFT_548550 [Choanephora cucurbitarum]|nr:hypothetical protein EDC96DRAFT_548550 [Choanephora cucurbitarum]